jgi:hypothetical protein
MGNNMKNLINIQKYDEKRVLFLLVLVTIILRIWFVYSTFSKTGTSNWYDDLYYLYAGEQIAMGNWSAHQWPERPELIVGPVLPLLIAFFIKFFGSPIFPFFAYNVLITSLMIPVFFFLGKEIFNNKTGWFLVIWGVFFSEAFKYSPHILKEATLFLFVPLTFLFLIRSIKSENPKKNIVFASLSYAWLIHTDERFFAYFPVLVLIFLFTKPFNLRQFASQAGLWLLFGFLLMLPWGIRNYIVFDQLVILTPRTTAITSKFWGNDFYADAHFSSDDVRSKSIEGRYDNAIEFGNKHNIPPREFGKPEAKIRAFFNFWQPTYFKPTYIQYGFRPQIWSLSHNIASVLFYGIFLPFYFLGILQFIRKKKYLELFLAFIPILHSLIHAYMVWPLERYRSPVTFLVVMIGIFTILEQIKGSELKIFVKLKKVLQLPT